MPASFEWNPREHKDILQYAAVAAGRQAVAKAIIARAKALSHSKGFSATLAILDEAGGDDPSISVGSKWPFAHLVEWGSVNNSPQAPLRKAVTGLNIQFKEE